MRSLPSCRLERQQHIFGLNFNFLQLSVDFLVFLPLGHIVSSASAPAAPASAPALAPVRPQLPCCQLCVAAFSWLGYTLGHKELTSLLVGSAYWKILKRERESVCPCLPLSVLFKPLHAALKMFEWTILINLFLGFTLMVWQKDKSRTSRETDKRTDRQTGREIKGQSDI